MDIELAESRGVKRKAEEEPLITAPIRIKVYYTRATLMPVVSSLIRVGS